ncbi:MAG: hypothetical protein LBV08_05660 [Clostridiales bacterium]|jgi:uncharacterized membrane protein HdeD (DUF308 family)|nr:hypothetical protein [Clostridiales bacterium]
MKYWKEHQTLRIILILFFFITGIALTIGGWLMAGKVAGLIIMLIGAMSLLMSLLLYNKPFESIKPDKKNKFIDRGKIL